MPEKTGTTGVLIAAGRGRRMGGTKQLVSWPGGRDGPTPLVAAAFDSVAPWCERMVVVLGHELDRVVETLGPREFEIVHADPDAPMFESIRRGLAAAFDGDGRRALLQLGDHPEVRPATVERLLGETEGLIAVMPEYDGRGGHPVVVPRGLWPRIDSWRGEDGLRGFWIAHPETCRRIRVEDGSCVRDVDRPEDLPG